MEYFAARHLFKEIKENKITGLCKLELNVEVMHFISEMLDSPSYYEQMHQWLEFKTGSRNATARRNTAHILQFINRHSFPSSLRINLNLTRGDEFVHVSLHDKDTAKRWRALVALAWIGNEKAVKTSQSLLMDSVEDDTRILRIAVLTLGLLGVNDALNIIVHKLLTAEDFLVRQNSAVALGCLGNVTAISKLIQSLDQDDNYRVRRSAIWAIEVLDPIMALDALSNKARNDLSDEVRQYATFAIGRIGGDVALKELAVILQDPNPLVRKASLQSIGEIGGVKALELAEYALNDLDSDVKNVARQEINRIRTSGGETLC